MISNSELRSLVDTIVVVMLENRSFDHVLGFLSHESFDGRADVDGLHRTSDEFDFSNPDLGGNLHPPKETPDRFTPFDLPHSRQQISGQINGGRMDGFIREYFASQDFDRSPLPMGFCRPNDIPVTAKLARSYTVCDRWFASIPTDTQPNRLMALCGDTLIDSTSSIDVPFDLIPRQSTLFDWLESRNLDFEIYVDADSIPVLGVPSNLLLMPSQRGHLAHANPLDALPTRWAANSRAPQVVFCEPLYNDFATVLGVTGTCNHPPLPMAFGEKFLKRVYLALTSNPAKWARTVLLVCYDEHGGYFDHVRPPRMHYAPPQGSRWADTRAFETLGIRIPGLVISPLVERGSVFKGLLDHTSILQLIVDRFGNAQDLAFYGNAVTRKANGVVSLAQALGRSQPRANDMLPLPDVPHVDAPATAARRTHLGDVFQAVLENRG